MFDCSFLTTTIIILSTGLGNRRYFINTQGLEANVKEPAKGAGGLPLSRAHQAGWDAGAEPMKFTPDFQTYSESGN